MKTAKFLNTARGEHLWHLPLGAAAAAQCSLRGPGPRAVLPAGRASAFLIRGKLPSEWGHDAHLGMECWASWGPDHLGPLMWCQLHTRKSKLRGPHAAVHPTPSTLLLKWGVPPAKSFPCPPGPARAEAQRFFLGERCRA